RSTSRLTLFPYTTLFRSGAYLGGNQHNRETIIPSPKSSRLAAQGVRLEDLFEKSIVRLQASLISKTCYDAVGGHDEGLRISMDRSEEHTSELQSLRHLVC